MSVRSRWLAAVLMLALVPTWLQAAAPAAAPGGQPVAAILEEQRVHGYPSPLLALRRLREAGGQAASRMPLDLRRRYYGELSYLADVAARPALAARARGRLQALAAQGCLPCRAELLIARAHRAIDDRHGERALDHLAGAEALVPATDAPMQLALAYARVFALDAASRPTEAVEQAVAAIKQAERLGSTAMHVRLLIVLIGLNADLGYLDRALEVADDAMALAGPLDYAGATSLIWLNRGHIHSLQGDRERQYRALRASLEIATDVAGLERTEVISRSNLADYYLYRQDYRTALQQAERAAALARGVDYEAGLTVALANAGIALSRMGRVEEGIGMLRQSIDLARGIDQHDHVVGITHELVKVLEAAGRYREALDAMHAIAALNEQVTREERARAVLEVQERYASERKSREIRRLSAENRAKEAELEARSWRQRLWAALALAFALAATLLVQWLTRSQRVNRYLKRANANLAEKTHHDPLTGVANRRRFDRMMARMDDMPDSTVGLMVLDLDHFKQVNDGYGHDAGDAVLVEVAARLSMLLREQDAVVRWGGEEFVLVLPGTTSDGLPVLADRVLRTVADTPVWACGQRLAVTVSIGAVAHPVRPGESWEESFRLADAAMYLAKQSGRNRAVCLGALDPEAAMDPVAGDLAMAERAGMLSLVRVEGPVPHHLAEVV